MLATAMDEIKEGMQVGDGRPFRITHLSDLHLTRTDGARRTEPKLFGALKGMNAAFRKIVATRVVQRSDLVIITGDVTDRGDAKSWQVFWDIVRQAGLDERLFVVPGNHDVCCLGLRLPTPRKGYLRKDLEKARAGLRMGRLPTKFPSIATPDPRVVIFGLNSNNLGNFSVLDNAMGELGYYQLAALASDLHKYRDVPVKIVALHHSPNIPGRRTAERRGQRPFTRLERIGHQIPDGQRRGLRLLCITQRVRLVVHGHLHMAEKRKVGGIRIVGAPSTTEPYRRRRRGKVYRFYTYIVQGKGGRVLTKLREVAV